MRDRLLKELNAALKRTKNKISSSQKKIILDMLEKERQDAYEDGYDAGRDIGWDDGYSDYEYGGRY